MVAKENKGLHRLSVEKKKGQTVISKARGVTRKTKSSVGQLLGPEGKNPIIKPLQGTSVMPFFH